MRARWLFWILVAAPSCVPAAPPPAPPPKPREDTSVVRLGGGEGAFDPGDRDGDGIPDAYDLCPAYPEDGKGAHPFDGCPDDKDPAKHVTPWGASPKSAVKVTRAEIKITEEILFSSGSATIDPASQALLRSIGQILKDVPEIELVEIAGHADSSGSDDANRKLTGSRAISVMNDLVHKGIAAGRLRSAGYSAYCPLAAGTDDAARARNRRVEFRILRRDGNNLEPRWGGCPEAEKHGLSPAPLPPPRPAAPPLDEGRAARACAEGEARTCSARCDKGDVSSCEALANLFAADDPRRAFKAASRACDLGALHFCVRIAGYLRQGKGVAKDMARAHDLVLKACSKGNGRACTDAGRDHHQGNAVAKDETKAAELYQRGCEAGDGTGCELLGAAFWTGTGVPKDHRHAIEIDIAGCELGSLASCAAAGKGFKDEPTASRSRGRALAALHVACEQDDTKEACDALHDMEEQPGEYAPLPVCSAGDFKTCREACAKEKAGAPCVDFGIALLYGTGVRRRGADALALFMEACHDGNAKGCAMSAVVRAGNNDDPKAERAAAADFESACAMGEQSGCINHALMELDGLGTYRDEEAAAKALDAACTQNVGIACAHLARLVKKGTGVRADEARARTLEARACTAGFRPACPAPPT